MKAHGRTSRIVMRLALLLAVLTAMLAVSAKPAASALGHWLVFEKTDFDRVDAIVVLGGGIPDRALQGRDLFNEKKAPRIVLVREGRRPYLKELDKLGIHLPGDCDLNRQVLVKSGISAESIEEVPGDVESTWEEAQAFGKYASRERIRSVVVVTCRFHTRRAYLNFERACGSHVRIYMVPSKYCEQDPNGWWKQRDQMKQVYIEVANLLAYHSGFR